MKPRKSEERELKMHAFHHYCDKDGAGDVTTWLSNQLCLWKNKMALGWFDCEVPLAA